MVTPDWEDVRNDIYDCLQDYEKRIIALEQSIKPQPHQKEQFSRGEMEDSFQVGFNYSTSPDTHRDFNEWLTEYLNSKTKPL